MTDDYLPARLRLKPKDAGGGNIWTLLTRDASKVRGHSAPDPGVSPQKRAYPVVIMRAGGSAGVLNYSTLAEDLASHGYIVVGFDAPYRTGLVVFPDGRVMRRTAQNNPERCVVPDRAEMEGCVTPVIAAWTGDMAFVLERLDRLNVSDSTGRFTGRLDMSRVGVFGHSLGGAVAAQFCHEDSRCKAGIDIDGALHGSVIQAGLSQPFMFLLSDHGDTTDPESQQIVTDIKSIYDRLPSDRRLYAMIRGAFHFTFTDDGALMKSSMVRGFLRLSGRLGIDARRQLAVTRYCVHGFFDAYLKGPGGARLSIASPLYPEIELLE
jgi:predicted dienelactone hydrolase